MFCSSQTEISDSVSRYHRGLVVLVRPWKPEGGTKGDEDGIRLTMDREDCGKWTRCLLAVMEEHHIGYMVKGL